MALGAFLRDRPRFLEHVYKGTEKLFWSLDPLIRRLGYERANRWFRWPEELGKRLVFDCQMCGQCILHSTGMTCPMSCPKNLRNGPCGGVRTDGHCEVKPEMACVWNDAYERSLRMSIYGEELLWIEPPVNRRLEGTSAWVNMLTGVDRQVPEGWHGTTLEPEIRSAGKLTGVVDLPSDCPPEGS
ncbi:MAG: methylenetetrahydrofolate reductase C-terminal domain-containing protein [Chloroflexota bacterium]|nr:methylenetetrahydrofolate reductase C-terminal domain-containing protein [Chloroflexota bacterium]